MPFTLEQVVPWGRSFDEYIAMFALTSADLRRRILGCGDGPAAFNTVASRNGGRVISVDPIYAFSKEQLRRRIEETYSIVMAETERNRDEFVWRHVQSPAELGRLRMRAMEDFLEDYEAGVAESRYIVGELPSLPFTDSIFDLVLCSHFLFLYSQHLDLDFHIESIKELSRIAGEVRIFPLVELGARKSRHLDAALVRLSQADLVAEVTTVDYEFAKGGNQMLRVTRAAA